MDYIFPELKESEDEKIRKSLIEHFQNYESCTSNGVSSEEVLAWLEKQGEQKPIDYNEELKKCREIHLYFIDKYVKLKEQKPAWSEEDAKNLQGIIDEIEANKSEAPEYDLKTYDRFLFWLESLKERLI